MSSAITTAGDIVVADDDIDIRLLVATIAEQAGWRVEAVGDGHAALDAARQDVPAAVVLDVNMPGMSGIDVCRILKRVPATQRVPVLIMSAETSRENRAAARDAGCDRFLPKPFSRGDLLRALDEMLSRARAEL